MNGSLVKSSRLPQALFSFKNLRSLDFITCISSVEVFLAAASAFSIKKWCSLDSIPCIISVEAFPAAAGAFFLPKMTFLGFYDMY